MAPLYHIDLVTKSGTGANTKLVTLLKNTANAFWKHGAVVADMRSWGTQELAYRCGLPSDGGSEAIGRWTKHTRAPAAVRAGSGMREPITTTRTT